MSSCCETPSPQLDSLRECVEEGEGRVGAEYQAALLRCFSRPQGSVTYVSVWQVTSLCPPIDMEGA
jgi:hypothetical protein